MSCSSQDPRKAFSHRIGVVGTGPTALYTLQALLESDRPCDIHLYEAGEQAGPGIPFSTDHATMPMLANIAGIELPPLCETLNDWAKRQDTERLAAWGITETAADNRAFFPRLVLGAYFADQFDLLLARHRGSHQVTVHRCHQVTDVVAYPDGVRIAWDAKGSAGTQWLDRLVIATGYRSHGDTRPSRLPDGQQNIGILGSSLSAIDAIVTLALQHGEFVETPGGLTYRGDTSWQVTMLSRSGLLPEADFWFPFPLEPLDLFTDQALAQRLQGRDGDLDRIFALFARQLRHLDPAYADSIDLDSATADTFADRYFARRQGIDPFIHARENLGEARASHRQRRTQAWRYAILRMHEPFGRIVSRLSPADLKRFEGGIKRCFTDNYAAVPHLSIERLLALREAGVLDLVRLGPSYGLSKQGGQGWHIRIGERSLHFDSLIDARGQQPLGLDLFPFPTLRLQLCARARNEGLDWSDGLPSGEDLVIAPDDPALGRIHCLALPFLLKRRPFVQGLCESAAMGRSTAKALLRAASQKLDQPEDARCQVSRYLATLDATRPVYCGDEAAIRAIHLPRKPAEAPPRLDSISS
jgi:uncharacterized NAD(P)/FAD-binding protein YdhS